MHRAPDCIISKSLVQHKITNHHQHHHHQYTLCWCNSSDIGQGSVRQTGGLQTIQCPQSEWGRGRSYKTENAEKEFRLKKAYILYMYNFIKDLILIIANRNENRSRTAKKCFPSNNLTTIWQRGQMQSKTNDGDCAQITVFWRIISNIIYQQCTLSTRDFRQ